MYINIIYFNTSCSNYNIFLFLYDYNIVSVVYTLYIIEIEAREMMNIGSDNGLIFARKEAKFRMQQQAELQALLKRIECRRKEHIKQRNTDSKRLLQRNKNVQSALESKHSLETQRQFDAIKKNLQQMSGDAVNTKARISNGGVSNSSAANSLGKSTRLLPASPNGTPVKPSSGRPREVRKADYHTPAISSSGHNGDQSSASSPTLARSGSRTQVPFAEADSSLSPTDHNYDPQFLSSSGPLF